MTLRGRISWPRAGLAALATAIALLAFAPPCAADEPADVFARGVLALQKGDFTTAIAELESLADRGFVHPDASFDRGLAYVSRVRAGADRPGDLGRAAAAFAEASLLRGGDDDEASRALDAVRAEAARRRSRQGREVLDVRPSLSRLVVGLASERAYSIVAFIASLGLAAALVLRRRTGPAHVVGSVLAPTSALALTLFAGLAFFARHLAETTAPGIIVASEVHLTDELGTTRGGEPIPEAAAVEVAERSGTRVRVRWGSVEGWAPAGSVRVLTGR